MTNKRIRIKMIEAGIKQWELARLLGVNEMKVSRMFRDELSEEEQDRIISIIENARGEDSNGTEGNGDKDKE